MIDHIAKYTTKSKYKYVVFYKSGYVRSYNMNENLPDTVLDVLLNGLYYKKYLSNALGQITTKYERFTPNR